MAFEVVRVLSKRLIEGENATILDLREKNRQLAPGISGSCNSAGAAYREETQNMKLQLAYRIQMSILPEELPAPAMLRIWGAHHPGPRCGGDFYGVIPLATDKAQSRWGMYLNKGAFRELHGRTHALLSAEAHRRATPSGAEAPSTTFWPTSAARRYLLLFCMDC